MVNENRKQGKEINRKRELRNNIKIPRMKAENLELSTTKVSGSSGVAQCCSAAITITSGAADMKRKHLAQSAGGCKGERIKPKTVITISTSRGFFLALRTGWLRNYHYCICIDYPWTPSLWMDTNSCVFNLDIGNQQVGARAQWQIFVSCLFVLSSLESSVAIRKTFHLQWRGFRTAVNHAFIKIWPIPRPSLIR